MKSYCERIAEKFVQYRPVKSKLGAVGPSMAPTALDGPRRPIDGP